MVRTYRDLFDIVLGRVYVIGVRGGDYRIRVPVVTTFLKCASLAEYTSRISPRVL